MVLIDTSVWVNHLRVLDEAVSQLLLKEEVLMHPFVVGEVALGTLRSRKSVLRMFEELPQAKIASPHEVLRLIDHQQLSGMGIGYVDVHLLASVRLTPYGRLWTRDKRLESVARQMGVLFAPGSH